MFCAPITFLQYFKNIKTGGGGLFLPLTDVTGEAKQPSCLRLLKYCKNFISAQKC